MPPRFVLDPAARQFKEGEDAQNGKPVQLKKLIRRARLIFVVVVGSQKQNFQRPENQEAGGSDLFPPCAGEEIAAGVVEIAKAIRKICARRSTS